MFRVTRPIPIFVYKKNSPVLPAPFEDVEVSVRSGPCAGLFVPGATVGPAPLENVKVSPPAGVTAGALVPGATVRPVHGK